MPQEFETAEAQIGERMIEVRVRFFTDSIVPGAKGTVRPRHALTRGEARITPNEAHGIASRGPQFFNSLGELPLAIEKALVDARIKLQPFKRTRKLISED